MKINNSEVKNYMTMKFGFTGTRIYEDALIPVTWEISLDMVGIDAINANESDIKEAGSIAYQKIYFFLESNLTNIVLCNANSELGLYVSNIVENNMMYCPDEPSDDLVVQLLHSKLSTIAGNSLHIGNLVLSASDTSASYTFNGPDAAQGPFLPSKVSEFMSQESLHVKPWWTRSDGFCFEFVRMDETDDTPLKEVYSEVFDPLEDYENSLRSGVSSIVELDDTPAEIIKVDAWNPQKV